MRVIGKILATALCAMIGSSVVFAQSIKVLIIDGQNDHKNWQQITPLLKTYLEETKIFTVDILTNPPSEGGELDSFKPNFSEYNVVLSNYNGYSWPQKISKDFEDFVNAGGGVVIVHAANNSFPDWPAYNRMIGVGGGQGRPSRSGTAVSFNEGRNQVEQSRNIGEVATHGNAHPFRVIIRNRNHPITNGLPQVWLHENDALYNELRGPATNMEVLATAFSAKGQNGSDKHEPVIMVISYGKGRVFHTSLGHGIDAYKSVGFITILQRGAEWAATGSVTQKVPSNFPTANSGSRRP